MLGRLARLFILCLVLVQHRKCPNMTEKTVDWDVRHQLKKIKDGVCSFLKVLVKCILFSPLLCYRYLKP